MMIDPYVLEKLSQWTKEQIERQARRFYWIGTGETKKTISGIPKRR
jgi:hypothetical protein